MRKPFHLKKPPCTATSISKPRPKSQLLASISITDLPPASLYQELPTWISRIGPPHLRSTELHRRKQRSIHHPDRKIEGGRSSRTRLAAKYYTRSYFRSGRYGAGYGHNGAHVRHAHACVDVTEPAPATAAIANSNSGSSERSARRASSRDREEASNKLHRSLFCAAAAPFRDCQLIIAICNLCWMLSHERTGRGTMDGPLGTCTKAHSRNYAAGHAAIRARINGSRRFYRGNEDFWAFLGGMQRLYGVTWNVHVMGTLGWLLWDCRKSRLQGGPFILRFKSLSRERLKL